MCNASDKMFLFQPENAPKTFGGFGASPGPGPTGGAYNAAPDSLSGFNE